MKKVVLLAIFCNILWAFSYVFQKIAASGMPVTSVVFWRFSIGFCGLFLILKLMKLPLVTSQTVLVRAFVIGLVVYLISPICQVYGILHSKALNAGIMVVCEPLFAIIMAAIFLKERFQGREWIGLLMVLIGITLLASQKGDLIGSGNLAINLALLALLFSIMTEGLQGILSKPIMDRVHPFVLALYSYFFSALLALITCLVSNQNIIPAEWSPNLLGSLLYLGLVCTTVAYSLWYWVISQLEVSKAILFVYIQPLVAPVASFLFLGETMNQAEFLALGLVLSGVFICLQRPRQSL